MHLNSHSSPKSDHRTCRPDGRFARWPRRIGLILLLVLGPAAAQTELVGSLAYTTDYVHRGVTQSSGQGALQAGAALRRPEGFYVSAWVSTLELYRLGPDFGDGDALELDLLLGLSRPLDSQWTWNLTAGRYIYSGDRRNLDYNYYEFSADLSFRDRLRLSVAWTPEVTDHTRNPIPEAMEGSRTVVEAAGQWPLRRWLSLNAGFGYNDSSEVADLEYTYWSAGASLHWRRCTLDLAHYSTDSEARGRWADGRAADRFAASLILSFD